MKMTFKTLLAATALSIAANAAFAQAPAVAPAAPAAAPAATMISVTRMAVVNITGIMRDASAAQSVRAQLEAKQKAYQAEIAKKEEALQKEDAELTKQRASLTKEQFEAKVKAFRDRATATQKEVASKKATLDNAFEGALAQIQQAVTQIIAEMSREKGFAVALPTSQILYAVDGLDISAEVLQRLNARLPKVDVKFDGAPAAQAPAPAKKK